MRLKTTKWIYQQLGKERADHGGEFILVTLSRKGEARIAVEANENLVAGMVHRLAEELSQDVLKALIMTTLEETLNTDSKLRREED